MIKRRNFLVGLSALIAAPAVVSYTRLMPVRGIIVPIDPAIVFQRRYWVGGNGMWTLGDTTHWALTSGGPGGAPVPDITDDVIIDDRSGGPHIIVTGTVVARSLTSTGNSVRTLDFRGPEEMRILDLRGPEIPRV